MPALKTHQLECLAVVLLQIPGSGRSSAAASIFLIGILVLLLIGGVFLLARGFIDLLKRRKSPKEIEDRDRKKRPA